MRDLKVNTRVQECRKQLMWIGLAKYKISIQNYFWIILPVDVKNAFIWKENARKNAQKVEPVLLYQNPVTIM